MKKIGVYLSDNKFIGGAHQYTEQVIEALLELDKKEFQVYGLCENSFWFKKAPYSFKKIEIKENKLSKLISTAYNYFDTYGIGNKFFNNIFYNKIRIINNLNLDLIIFPSQNRESYLVKTKSLVTIHDLMHRYERSFSEYDKGEFNRRERKYKQISRNCSGILADSSLGKKHIIESYKINYNKVFILPFVSKKFDKIKQKHIKLPKNYIFYPAQFWEHKNHINLIEALNILKKKYNTNINLILTGAKKNFHKKVIKKISELNLKKNVKILYYVEDAIIKTLYKNAICLVYVSLCGPTNIPPLEAIKLKCPVIASNVYAMKNQLKNSALYVNALNPKDIAKKIFVIFTNKKKVNSLLKTYKNFNLRNNQKKFNNNLNKIIKSLC